MAYDISALTPREQVTAIYVAYYDRAPDPGGLNFWTAQLEEFLDGDGDGNPGMSLQAIATAFANSQESKDLYGYFDPDVGGSSGAFLTSVYINLFGRLPDADGLLFWQGKLDSGQLPVGEALLAIMGGAQGSDIAILENKVEVALDWHDDALANGRLLLTPEDEVAARTILDNVDETDASVTDAKATTDAYFNDDPVAADDAASTDEDVAVTIDVLANDTDADGDTLTVTAVGAAANGTVVNNGDGTVTYTPDADYNGPDSFTYTVEDGHGGSDTATVTVDVAPVNDDPVAADDAASTDRNAAVTIDVLANDTDVDGDVLSVTAVSAAANGTVVDNGDGTVTYTPDVDFTGSDSFTYTVEDGQGGFDTATVTVDVTTPPGLTFILTDGIDASPAFDGGEGDDTYLANQNTLNNSDSLDGGGVGKTDNDILKVSVQAGTGSFFVAPTLVNIETIEVNGPNLDPGQNITFDLSNASGYETLRSYQTTANVPNGNLVAFRDIQDAVNTDLEIIDTDVNHSFRYDSNAFATLFGGNDDAVDMTVQEVDGSTINLGLENPLTPGGNLRSHVDIVNLTSLARHQVNPTTFNYIFDLNVGPYFNELNVTGDADLEIERFLDENVNDVDASTLDGDFTIDLLGQGTRVLHVDPNVYNPEDTEFDVIGDLQVLGAIGDNDIDVKGDTNGTFIFQGGNDVLWVGSADDMSHTREDVFGNVAVDTQGGNDEVVLNITGQQNVALGDGNDRLIVNGNVDDLSTIDYNDGLSIIDAGPGNDYVELNGQPYDDIQDLRDLDNDYWINLGSGNDTLVANQGGEHTVFGGKGEDNISIFGHGNQTIDSGEDDDRVLIEGDGTHNILLGDGNDDLTIIGSRLTGNHVDGVGPNTPTFIDAGPGDDTVFVNGDHILHVLLGDGADSIELNAHELTVDDFIDGGNADGPDVDDTIILNNLSGTEQDGSVGRSETSSTTGIEVFDLHHTNISLALSSDNFDTSVDKNITVRTTEAASSTLIEEQDGSLFLVSPAPGKMTVDITNIPMSVGSGRSFTLEGGTIRDVIIADDASISSRLVLDFDAHPDLEKGDQPEGTATYHGDSREDTLQVIDGAHISAADQQNFSGLDIIELLADSNQAQTWTIEVTADTVNQSSDDAPFTIRVDPNVGAGSKVFIDVDPSTYTASMDDPLIIETNANVEIYVDFNDGNGWQLIGEPLWGTELLGANGLNVPVGGGIFVQERLLFTQNTDSLNGDQSWAGQNDTFIVDSMSKLQEADSADGQGGWNTLLFDNVTVSNQNEDLYDQINKPQLLNIQEIVFDTGMNVQMNRLDDVFDGNDLQDMLLTLRTGSGNDRLLDMETIGDDWDEGYFLGGGDDYFSTYPGGFFPPEGTPWDGTSSEDYYVDGGLGDDTAIVRDQDDLYGTDIETIYLYDPDDLSLDGADAILRTVQGVDGSSMTVYGDENDTERNHVDLDSSIRKASDGTLATVVLYDIDDVDDGTSGDDQDQIIVLDNNESGPDGDADISLNGGTDHLTVTNVDDLVVTATNGDKTVSVGEAGPGLPAGTGTGGLLQPNSSVNTFDYNVGAPLNDDVDNITAVVDDLIQIRAGGGDDIIVAETTGSGSTIRIGGGDGDDTITATPSSMGGFARIDSGDGADTVNVTTQDTATSTIITGLGGDGAGDTVHLYTPDTGADPDGGADTIVLGNIVYDSSQEIDTGFTTQNFLQKGIDSTEVDGVSDSIDTITGFNMEGAGGPGAADVLDVSAFITDNAAPLDANDFGYGDWTGGGQTALTKVGSGAGTKEVAVIAVDDGFELDASHIKENGPSPDAGIYIGDNDARVVVAAYDTDNDGAFDTADIYFVQDVDSGPGQAWAVDHVSTVEFATEIGSITTINEDNFIF